jgi:hypothetical protein
MEKRGRNEMRRNETSKDAWRGEMGERMYGEGRWGEDVFKQRKSIVQASGTVVL